MNKPIRFVRALSMLTNPKTWGPFTEVAEISGFDHAVSLSWSQGGEDLALISSLEGGGVGRYLDIGAHHPSRFSVTRHLYQRGWTGVNVEANSSLLPEFNKKRKNDINLWNAVGDKSNYQLSVFEEPAISTINKDWEEKFISENQKISRVEEVPGITVRELLNKYFLEKKCNLLTIDIEGADFEALKTIDFQTLKKSQFPDWILLETTPPLTAALKTDSVAYAQENAYFPHLILPMATLLRNGN